jgi:hypothetical protein
MSDRGQQLTAGRRPVTREGAGALRVYASRQR